jgi:hypothetical protein
MGLDVGEIADDRVDILGSPEFGDVPKADVSLHVILKVVDESAIPKAHARRVAPRGSVLN